MKIGQIKIEHASFSLEDDHSKAIFEDEFKPGQENILKKINFHTHPGSLVGVIGPVGAGKSCLLKAILGQMETTEGYVETKGRISYIS